MIRNTRKSTASHMPFQLWYSLYTPHLYPSQTDDPYIRSQQNGTNGNAASF